jgi:hypothetical protein
VEYEFWTPKFEQEYFWIQRVYELDQEDASDAPFTSTLLEATENGY